MKTIYLIILLFIISILSAYAGTVVIKGHIKTESQDSLFLFGFNSPADYIDYNPEKMRIAATRIDNNGNFRFQISLNEPKSLSLISSANANIFNDAFFVPGDSVFIESRDTVMMGYRAALSKYYGSGAYSLKYNEDFGTKGFYGYFGRKKLSIEDYCKYIDSLAEAQENFTAEFVSQNKAPQAFAGFIRNKYYWWWKNEKLQFLWANETHKVFKVEPSFFNFIPAADINNSAALNCTYYYRFLQLYPSDLWDEKEVNMAENAKKDRPRIQKLRLHYIPHCADSLFKGQVKEAALSIIIADDIMEINAEPEIRDYKLKIIDSLLSIIKPADDKIKGSVYERLLAKKRKAMSVINVPAPGFTLKDKNGNKLSLADMKGKVVLLDFWEPGCPPCMAEIPNSNQLQKDLEGKPFVMMGICCASNETTWKNILENKKWNGTHLLADKTADMMDKYAFDGYPHYVIIDKKGIIRNADANRDIATLEKEITKLMNE